MTKEMIDKLSADLREMAHSRDFYIFQNAILLDALEAAEGYMRHISSVDDEFGYRERAMLKVQNAIDQVKGKPSG